MPRDFTLGTPRVPERMACHREGCVRGVRGVQNAVHTRPSHRHGGRKAQTPHSLRRHLRSRDLWLLPCGPAGHRARRRDYRAVRPGVSRVLREWCSLLGQRRRLRVRRGAEPGGEAHLRARRPPCRRRASPVHARHRRMGPRCGLLLPWRDFLFRRRRVVLVLLRRLQRDVQEEDESECRRRRRCVLCRAGSQPQCCAGVPAAQPRRLLQRQLRRVQQLLVLGHVVLLVLGHVVRSVLVRRPRVRGVRLRRHKLRELR
jgi:hypothetical protein